MKLTSKYENELQAFLLEKQKEKASARESIPRLSSPPPSVMLQLKEWINHFALRMTFPWVFGLALLVTLLATLIVFLMQPSVDAVADIRLFEHYGGRTINNLETDDRFVYLSTNGNGLQRYDKQTYLWQTFDEKNTAGQLPNYINQVALDSVNNRLWVLSGSKDILTAPSRLQPDSIQSLLKTSTTWANLKEKDFVQGDKRDHFLYLGSSTDGAAAYNTIDHSWTTFPEASTRVSQLAFDKGRFFIAGNRGVHIFNPNQQHQVDSLPALQETSIRKLTFGDSLILAVSRDSSLFAFAEKNWQPAFGGGTGLYGLKAEDITHAEMHDEHLFIAASGEGLAVYNQNDHRWSALSNGYDFRQMTSTDTFIYTTHQTGMRIFEYSDSLRELPGSYLHRGDTVTIQHNSGKAIYYTISDQSLWRLEHYTPEVLLPAPDTSIVPPTGVRTVLHDGDSVLWLATANSGLLKYNMSQSRLKKGPYSIGEDGEPMQAKQLFKRGDTLIVLDQQGKAFYYNNGFWSYPPYHEGIKKLIPYKNDFLVVENDNALIKDGWKYFDAKLNGTVLPKFKGELMQDSQRLIVVLPEDKLAQYDPKKRTWEDLPYFIPPFDNLINFHAVDDQFTLVTQHGEVYDQYNTIFKPSVIPGPLEEVVAMTPTTNGQTALMAWPDQIAFYQPTTGQWSAADITNNTSPFQGVGEVQDYLYAFSEHELWEMDEQADTLAWRKVGLERAASQFWFSKNHVWYTGPHGALSAYQHGLRSDRLNVFFQGTFPSLSDARFFVLQDERFLWAVSEQHVGRYDKQNHSWFTRAVDFQMTPQDSIRQALFHMGRLYVRTDQRVFAFRYMLDSIESEILPLNFEPYTLSISPGSVLAWQKNGDHFTYHNLTFSDGRKKDVPLEKHNFMGDLTKVVLSEEVAGKLWVIDEEGHLGIYQCEHRTWSNFQLEAGERPVRLIPVFDQILLEAKADDDYFYYNFNFYVDSLEPLDRRFEKPEFKYYQKSNRLFLADGDNIIYEISESVALTQGGQAGLDIISLHNEPEYHQVYSYQINEGLYALLLENKKTKQQVIHYQSDRIKLPESARLNAIRKIKGDGVGRVWILGGNNHLYVTRVSSINNPPTSLPPFEQQLEAHLTAVDLTTDFPDRLTGTVYSFDIAAIGGNLRVWTAVPGKINQYELNPSNARFKAVRSIDLPKAGKAVQDLAHPGSGNGITVRQQDRLYLYNPASGGFQQFRNIFTRYDSELWEKLPKRWLNIDEAAIDPIARKVWQKARRSNSRWQLTTQDGGYIAFSYMTDTLTRKFHPLPVSTNAFKKDLIHDLASPNSLYLLMATEEGLLQYDPYGANNWRRITDEEGADIQKVDQLYTQNGMLWLRQGQVWKKASFDRNNLSLQASSLVQTVHYDSTRQLLWTQQAPGLTGVTLEGRNVIGQQGLLTDQLVDFAVIDTNLFISTQGAMWQLKDTSRLGELSLSATLKNARFFQADQGQTYAISGRDTFGFTQNGWEKKAIAPGAFPDWRSYEVNGTKWQMQKGQQGVVPVVDQQLRRVDNGRFTDDIIADAIPYSNGYWMASCSGLWFLARDGFSTARGKTLLPDRSFLYFFKDQHRLYVVDSQDKVYEYTNRQWKEAPNLKPHQLVKGFSNGNICFTQNGDRITLERSDDKKGPVWVDNALTGEGVSGMEVVGDHLWGILPGKGVARYRLDESFLVLDSLYQTPFGEQPPVEGKFLRPANSRIIYLKTDRGAWRIQGDSLISDDGTFWQQPILEEFHGKLQWRRPQPLAEELELHIDGKKMPAIFTGNQMAFDALQAVYANGDGTIWLGNELGVFRLLLGELSAFAHYFNQTFHRPIIMDFFPEPEGVTAIAEAEGQLYIINGAGQRRVLTTSGFADTPLESAFYASVPSLVLEAGKIQWQPQRIPEAKYAHPPQVEWPENAPLFNATGTFTFDQLVAVTPLSKNVWLGACSVGLVEYQWSGSENWQMTAFYPYHELDSIRSVVDLQKRDSAVFIHALDRQGNDQFYFWKTGVLTPYAEREKGTFNRTQLVFQPKSLKWTARSVPHDSAQALVVETDEAYELFVPDRNDVRKGRFAFDDIEVIKVADHVIRTTTKAGTVIYQYHPEAADPGDRLVFQEYIPARLETARGAGEPKPEEPRYETVYQGKGIHLQQEQGTARQILRIGENVEWTTYSLPVDPAQLERIGDTLYYLHQDSFLFQYDLETGAKTAIEELYVARRVAPVRDPVLPLELGRYYDTLIVTDDAHQRYALYPGLSGAEWLNQPLASHRLFSIGPLTFETLGGQIIVSGREIAPMLVAENFHALAWKDRKLWVCGKPKQPCLLVEYDVGENRLITSKQDTTFIVRSGLYVEEAEPIGTFPEKTVSYELITALGQGSIMGQNQEDSRLPTEALVVEKKDGNSTFAITSGGMLLVNGRIVSYTDDLLYTTRISDVVDLKRGKRRIWVATDRKLIQIKP